MPQPASTRLGLVGPSGGDPITNGDDIIRALIAQLDPLAAMWATGTRTGMPAPATATKGRIFQATDTGGVYLDTGSTYNTLHAPLVTALPTGTLYDGEEIHLSDTTNNVVWHLRYSLSLTKWLPIGAGSALGAQVATDEATSSTTYTDLTTVGPAVTVPVAGTYDVEIGCGIAKPGAPADAGGAGLAMSFAVGGTAAIDADSAQMLDPSTSTFVLGAPLHNESRKTGVAAGTTITAKYKVVGDVAPGHFLNRYIRVRPFSLG